jgi:hypothetical protein
LCKARSDFLAKTSNKGQKVLKYGIRKEGQHLNQEVHPIIQYHTAHGRREAEFEAVN